MSHLETSFSISSKQRSVMKNISESWMGVDKLTEPITRLSIAASDSHSLSDEPGPFSARVALTVIVIILIVVAISGNAIVIIAILRTPHLKRLNNYLIISLSLADLGSATFCMPFFVMELLHNYSWPLPHVICALYCAIEISFGLLSVFNLTAISCERVFLITKPMVYQRMVTEFRLILFIMVLWISSFTYGMLQIFWFYTDDYLQYNDKKSQCRYLPSSGFAIFAFLLAFVLPLGIMSGAYVKIFCIVKGQIKRIKPRPRLSSEMNEGISEDPTTMRKNISSKNFTDTTSRQSSLASHKTECLVNGNILNDKHVYENVPYDNTTTNFTMGLDAFKVLVENKKSGLNNKESTSSSSTGLLTRNGVASLDESQNENLKTYVNMCLQGDTDNLVDPKEKYSAGNWMSSEKMFQITGFNDSGVDSVLTDISCNLLQQEPSNVNKSRSGLHVESISPDNFSSSKCNRKNNQGKFPKSPALPKHLYSYEGNFSNTNENTDECSSDIQNKYTESKDIPEETISTSSPRPPITSPVSTKHIFQDRDGFQVQQHQNKYKHSTCDIVNEKQKQICEDNQNRQNHKICTKLHNCYNSHNFTSDKFEAVKAKIMESDREMPSCTLQRDDNDQDPSFQKVENVNNSSSKLKENLNDFPSHLQDEKPSQEKMDSYQVIKTVTNSGQTSSELPILNNIYLHKFCFESPKLQSALKRKLISDNPNNFLLNKPQRHRTSVQFQLYNDNTLTQAMNSQPQIRTMLADDEVTGSSEDNTAETSLSGACSNQQQSSNENRTNESQSKLENQSQTLQWAERHFKRYYDNREQFDNAVYPPRSSSVNKNEEVIKKSSFRSRKGFVENKAVKMTSYVIGAFVICWVPYQICMILRLFSQTLVPDILWNCTTVFMFTSTAVNPFIYNFYSSQFRAATKRLFRCNANIIDVA